MTADVNVTEKAREAALARWALGSSDTTQMLMAVDAALAALADPEVLAGIAGVLREVREGRCDHCFRPLATDDDWQTYEGGEGEHLCWETPGTCSWSPTVDPADIEAAAIVELLGGVSGHEHRAVVAAERSGEPRGARDRFDL